MCKEAVVADFKVILWQSSGGAVKNHEKLPMFQPYRPLKD
jgi:hypothetical protein